MFEDASRLLGNGILFLQISRQLSGSYLPSGQDNASFDNILKLTDIAGCQSAFKNDPPSASKSDPPQRLVFV